MSGGSIEALRVCSVEDVPPREGRTVWVGGRPLAIFNTDEGFRALDNTCTHMGGPLADGLVADATVACPLHERRFELATGRAVGHDCGGVGAYPVEIREGDVYVHIAVFEIEGQMVAGGAIN
jgi:nitrite reductase (NADH) small subunit